MSEQYKIIIDRQHQKLAEKSKVFKLCRDAYIGGSSFSADDYLIQNPNEYSNNFRQRKKLATYSNIIEPLIEIMTGLLFTDDIDRAKIPTAVGYILTNISNGIGINQYMHNLVKQMSLYPFVVLVDAPKDANAASTKDQRKGNPYAILYKFNEIRDFSIGTDGKFDWLLLDISTVDKSDPFGKPVEHKKYRLWTRKEYQDFMIKDGDVKTEGPVLYALGEIPAVMSGFMNIDDDVIESNVIENIVKLALKKYNLDSLIDEILFSGAFKFLAWPVSTSITVPKTVAETGLGEIAVIEYDAASSSPPSFIGAEVEDIQPYLTQGEVLVSDIYNQLGFNSPEDDKAAWNRSGVAISKDFKKTEAILKLWAQEGERIENEIIRFCSMWESIGEKVTEKVVTYPKDFEKTDIAEKIDQYFQALSLPYRKLQKYVSKKIVKTLFAKDDKKEIKELLDEIDQDPEVKDFDISGTVEKPSENKDGIDDQDDTTDGQGS